MLFGREEHAKLRIKINQENTVIVCNIDPTTYDDSDAVAPGTKSGPWANSKYDGIPVL